MSLTVLASALVTCGVVLFSFHLYGSTLLLKLAAIQSNFPNSSKSVGSALHRAAASADERHDIRGKRVLLLGSSSAREVYDDPDVLQALLSANLKQNVSVLHLAHGGASWLDILSLAALSKPEPSDVVLVGVSEVSLLGSGVGIGSLKTGTVFKPFTPLNSKLCKITRCTDASLFLLVRLAMKCALNLVTGDHAAKYETPVPARGLDDARSAARYQRIGLLVEEAASQGVNSDRIAAFEAFVDDLIRLSPGKLIFFPIPTPPNLVKSSVASKNLFEARALIAGILRQKGVLFLAELQRYPLSASNFSDPLHLKGEFSPSYVQEALIPALMPLLSTGREGITP